MSRAIHVSAMIGDMSAKLVHWVDETREVSRPNRATVRAAFDSQLDLEESLGAPALLIVQDATSTRRLRGSIKDIAVVATPSDGPKLAPVYEFTIASQLDLLEGNVDSQIFQDWTTDRIVAAILEQHGLQGLKAEWQLAQILEKRVYCTQYAESGLHFISRLLEEEGIYFYSATDEDGKEMLFFADTSTKAEASPSQTLPCRIKGGGDAETTAIYRLDLGKSIHSGKFTTKSFNFENPQLSLECSATGDLFDELETYIPSEPYTTEGQGDVIARNRLEHSVAAAQYGELDTNELLVLPGNHVSLQRTELDEPESFFVKQTRLRYAQTSKDASAAGLHELSITADVMPVQIPYRPPLVHQKPRIMGPQTALVVGEAKAEPETVLTDPFGRIKIRYHWDRRASHDDKASPWIRVAQLQTSGAIHLPRIDWEVLVEFLEGDPDQPIITGRLFNGQMTPPYKLPEGKTRTSLQTASSPAGGGRNEIRFEDTAGSEEVMVNSQYNTVINAANDRTTNVTANETLVVSNNALTTVGGNQELQTTNGFEMSVGANQTLDVAGNRDHEVNAVSALTVKGASTTDIGANWMSMVGSPLDALIALGTAKAAELASAKADQVMSQVEGAAQGAIDQAMGPIKGLTDQVNKIQGDMAKLSGGQLGAAGSVMGGAIALPTAAGMMSAIASGPAALNTADGADASAGEIAIGSIVGAAVTGTLTKAAKAAKSMALGEGSGNSGGAGGGQSQANQAGPDGALSGFSEADTTAGPGLSQYKLASTHKETVGVLRLCAAVESVSYNIAGSMTETVGAAHVELIKGNRAEAVEGASSEVEAGLIIVAKGGETETVKAASQLTIGGALMETVKGNYSIESEAAVALVGSMQDWKAKEKITIKCGASSIVIDGAGITMETPLLMVSGSSVKATKDVHDG